jgi:hypothetical protein
MNTTQDASKQLARLRISNVIEDMCELIHEFLNHDPEIRRDVTAL